jgi:hypothetical protein
MQATSVAQATAVTPATSDSNDDSIIMTAHNSRNANNSRNESNNKTANTVWPLTKAGMLAKEVKPAPASREANYSTDTVKTRDDSSSRDNRNIMDVISRRTTRTDRIKVSIEDSNIQQGLAQQ